MSTTTDLISRTLLATIRNNLEGTERDHREAFRREARNVAHLLTALADNAFDNRYRGLRDRVVVAPDGGSALTPKPINVIALPKQKRRRSTLERSAADLIEHMRTSLLMNTMLPNGKTLGKSRFGECCKFGGFVAAVGMQGPANGIVGRKLKEKDLRNLFDRHTAAAKKVA